MGSRKSKREINGTEHLKNQKKYNRAYMNRLFAQRKDMYFFIFNIKIGEVIGDRYR